MRIGTTVDYPPFSYLDLESGQLSGFDIDLIKLICLQLKISYYFINTTWSTFQNELSCGVFDIVIGGVSLTPPRKQNFLHTQAYIHDGKVPITHIDNKHRFNSFTDIDKPGVNVIVNPGGTNAEFVSNNIHRANVIVFNNNNLIFDEIVNKRADVMITDRIEAIYHANNDKRLFVVNPQHTLTHEHFGFLFNKKNAPLQNLIDGALTKFTNTPEFLQLCNAYSMLK